MSHNSAQVTALLQEPLPLVRASSRCYAPCDTVTWLSRKVKQLSDQLHTTQAALKKLMENPAMRDGEHDANPTHTHKTLWEYFHCAYS